MTPAGLAEWQRVRAEVAERNAALLAQAIVTERALQAEARGPMLARVRDLEAELATWRSVETARAEARQWAAEHPDATDRLPDLQAQASARAGADRNQQSTDDPTAPASKADHLHPKGP